MAISLRPEKVKLGKPLADGTLANRFDARIASATFIGSVLRYEVVMGGGLKLNVQTPNDAGHIWREGDEVQVGWAKESCVLLSE